MWLYCAVRTVAIWLSLGMLGALVVVSVTYQWSSGAIIAGMVVVNTVVFLLDRYVVRPVPDPRDEEAGR